MNSAEYEHELRSLGVSGPVGELKRDGSFVLAYRLFDGSIKLIPPPDMMCPAEMQSVLKEMREQIGLLHGHRSPDE